MKKIPLAFFLLAIMTTSCKKIRDDLLPQGRSKLYCQSILSPDSLVRVYVGRTTGILNMEPYIIADATVLLYKNSILCDTLTNEDNGAYTSIFRPAAGDLYTIRVNIESSLTGSATVPFTVQIRDPKMEFPTGYDAVNQQYFGELSFFIDDDPATENFYEVVIFTKTYSELTNSYSYFYRNGPGYILVPDKLVQNEGDWDYLPTTLFFSDQLFNGNKQQLTFSIADGYGIYDNVWISDLEKDGYILLRSISREYYLYRKYYTRHAYNAQIHSDGFRNMLFTGEPLDMYSNIDGGLGVVAAFSSTTSKIKRK